MGEVRDDQSVDHCTHAKRLRERAEEFRHTAEAIAEKQTKDSFFKLARSYDALAEAEEVAGWSRTGPGFLLPPTGALIGAVDHRTRSREMFPGGEDHQMFNCVPK